MLLSIQRCCVINFNAQCSSLSLAKQDNLVRIKDRSCCAAEKVTEGLVENYDSLGPTFTEWWFGLLVTMLHISIKLLYIKLG